MRYWGLNTFLLEDAAIDKIIEMEIKTFFDLNRGTADPIIVWEYFKAYITGIFISQKAYRLKGLQDKQDNLRKQLGLRTAT